MADDPCRKTLSEYLDGPLTDAARGMVDSPQLKAFREYADSPLARAARGMVDSPQLKAFREYADSPLARAARGMVDSPQLKAFREYADSPFARAAREMIDNPHLKAWREHADSPFARAARGMIDSPHLKALREYADSPMAHAARGMATPNFFTAERLGLGGFISGASPQAAVGTFIASNAARAARSAGILDQLIGESFAVDAIATIETLDESTERTGIETLSIFLHQITETARTYLSAVRSVPELNGLVQIIMLMLAVAAVYYAEQSPTAKDIKELGQKIETSIGQTEKATLEHQFNELLLNVQQLASSKQSELPPRRTYVARRNITVNYERRMASQAVGAVEVGDHVSIIQIDKKWIEFDFFDYNLGRASRGWAMKKYFRKLPIQ
jgi:hypothetical protein